MNESTKFEVGNLVKLKSGGPKMTVKELPSKYDVEIHPDRYICQWFAGKKLEEGIFPEDSLESIEIEK